MNSGSVEASLAPGFECPSFGAASSVNAIYVSIPAGDDDDALGNRGRRVYGAPV